MGKFCEGIASLIFMNITRAIIPRTRVIQLEEVQKTLSLTLLKWSVMTQTLEGIQFHSARDIRVVSSSLWARAESVQSLIHLAMPGLMPQAKGKGRIEAWGENHLAF